MHHKRTALLACLMVALTVAAGQALATIPNVELVTFIVFVSGFLLGPRTGAIVGAAGIGIHSMFNVMGAVVPPMLLAQVVSYALVGFCGGVVGPVVAGMRGRVAATLLGGLTGTGLTVFYQVVINITAYYTFTSGDSLLKYLWAGLGFTIMHIVWNTAVFTISLRPTLLALRRQRAEIAGGQ